MSKASALARYLNQTAAWIHYSSAAPTFDSYGNPTNYTTSTIRCRTERYNRLARDKEGREVVSDTTVYTQSAVVVGDMIEARKVLNVSDWPDFDGSIVGYEAVLE